LKTWLLRRTDFRPTASPISYRFWTGFCAAMSQSIGESRRPAGPGRRVGDKATTAGTRLLNRRAQRKRRPMGNAELRPDEARGPVAELVRRPGSFVASRPYCPRGGRQVGRVTPCAPFGELTVIHGAHGVTRPTKKVSNLLCHKISSTGQVHSTGPGKRPGGVGHFEFLIVHGSDPCPSVFIRGEDDFSMSACQLSSARGIALLFHRAAFHLLISIFCFLLSVFPNENSLL
jgi:hypothetical protein